MSQSRQLLIYLVAVFAWTWGIAAILVLAPDWSEATFGPMSGTNPLFVLAVYAPSLLSLILTAAFEGREGLMRLLARLDPRRGGWWWLVLIPVGFIVISWVSGLVEHLWISFTGLAEVGGWPQFAGWGALGSALTVMFLVEPGPIGEELGWRGFVLPRMLDRWSPLTSSLVLGVIWAVWHLPAFFISGTPQQGFALPIFFLGAVALSVVTTWIFVRTAGSVLLAMLVHRMANSANDLTLVQFEVFALGLGVVAVLALLFGRMRQSAPEAAKHVSA